MVNIYGGALGFVIPFPQGGSRKEMEVVDESFSDDECI